TYPANPSSAHTSLASTGWTGHHACRLIASAELSRARGLMLTWSTVWLPASGQQRRCGAAPREGLKLRLLRELVWAMEELGIDTVTDQLTRLMGTAWDVCARLRDIRGGVGPKTLDRIAILAGSDPATMRAVAAWRDVRRCGLVAFRAELADE